LGRKVWQNFLVGLIQVGILFGQIQIYLKIRGSAGVSQPRSCENKVNPNLFQLSVQYFVALLIFNTFWKFLSLGNSA